MTQEPLFDSSDPRMMLEQLRSSPAFPALLGGFAGAAISVAIMIVMNRMSKPKKTLPAAYDAKGNPMNVVYLPAPKEPRVLGFTLGNLFSLGMTGLTMFRQMQELRGNGMNPDATNLPPGSTLPPSPGEKRKTSHKK